MGDLLARRRELVSARAELLDRPDVALPGVPGHVVASWRRSIAGGVDRTDAVRTAGDGWGRTYHAQRPFVRIDFVFVDPALEVTSAQTTPVGFSDHRPVRVGLRWAAEVE